jgi:hypothetical protein
MRRKVFRDAIKGLFGGLLFGVGAFYARKFDPPFAIVILSISAIIAFFMIIGINGGKRK